MAYYIIHSILLSLFTDRPTVFSKQINKIPSIIVTEGDHAVITCEAPPSSQSTSLYPQWMLDGSMISSTPLLIHTNQPVPLKNGMELNVSMIDGPVYNDTALGEVHNFSIVLLNVNVNITGLTVYCGVSWEERNITTFYEQAAVVAVVPQDKSKAMLTACMYVFNCTDD